MHLLQRLFLLRKGYVRIHICGGFYERFLNLCANHHILLWNLCPVQKGYEADMYQQDFKKLSPIAKKCRTKIRICEKHGLPFFINRNRKRKMFAGGILLCAGCIYLLSCFIWNVSIEGNVSLSRQTLLAYLQEAEAGYGTAKRSINCKALAAQMRNDFPSLTWVSVRMRGTGLFVNVQENTDDAVLNGETAAIEIPAGSDNQKSELTCDLIADVSGEIVNMVTRRGKPLVKEGDTIAVGDLLVSGKLEITDDGGNVVSHQYCEADADIYVKTAYAYEDTFSLAHTETEYTGEKRNAWYIKLGSCPYGIDFGIQKFERADIVGRETQLKVLRDFYLPVSLCKITAYEYSKILKTYTKEEAISLAKAKLQKFIMENEQKGVQIFENNVKIELSMTTCRAAGTIVMIRKAGRCAEIQKTELSQEGIDE